MYRKRLKSWIKHLDFILLDFIVIQICFLVSFQFRHGILFLSESRLYRYIAIYLGLIDLVVMFFNESYKGILKRGYLVELREVIKHVANVNILLLLYLYILHNSDSFSRIIFFLMVGMELICMWMVRCGWKKHLLKKKKEQFQRSLIVVTIYEDVKKCISSLTVKEYDSFKITGLCLVDKKMTGEIIENTAVIADKETLIDYVRKNWVDEVFIYLPQNMELAHEIIRGCDQMGVTVHLALAHHPLIRASHQLIEDMGEYTVLTSSMNIATNRQSFLKRALDIAGGLIGSFCTIILTIIIGPMIYFQSPGPIFFSQERIGKNGKKFKMYKFRSMYMDAEERKKELKEFNDVKDGMMFKMKDDPRIIGRKNGKAGIGHFIRKTSIDEFPQFFNVLIGEMSLVGTRPPTVDEWEKYELHHRARMAIKPGITGLWQVSGRSNIKDFEEVVELDTSYIQKWNLRLDIKILWKTVGVVMKQEGTD